ncbi:bifunctional adenosylcobinamide kinase/adenosylcobinamide-phosphate guanylyltransferase [Mycolicibacterium vanbaalenii]|jgi:adenosylcobinamide kinase/adenosylcobinamide-phosphate guanylyltransferase|uniref:bifunctional adenosylcobinamide kinase/adenosylcobinamide-phosphate guanylyltransferase n=1 Tax=Mycolicibacterium vanbaalenii TaxID=110539 RepID=UPI001F48634C|nr:bifunctional adenosylcobinamide kinase/adenosylcobinamide-phosphate guanylyltransferase [Mycolicibacterium vanbaalenii]UJL29714.1 bifunctional adenosylcobinamide kinase/adenosylcobinamide-phosphate guanylyltransferase [Mycolicibacterium vanbaalenii]WND57235.1 bifunctional adenosylcobinamide kinase/adenosylcobinamide-phosphate guanylyltransferase [Mycolicibacterium vanbaalenii]
MRILVTGGVRSGKSRHAEALLSDARQVTYLAPGRPADGSDPDWDARVAGHRTRRPAHWQTVETADVAAAVRDADGAVLVDCLGTWLTAVLDRNNLWDKGSREVHDAVDARLTALCAALTARREAVVVVTNEVGLGVVPSHRSGVLFRDLLGTANQRVAAVCDEVHLVIAGRVLKI